MRYAMRAILLAVCLCLGLGSPAAWGEEAAAKKNTTDENKAAVTAEAAQKDAQQKAKAAVAKQAAAQQAAAAAKNAAVAKKLKFIAQQRQAKQKAVKAKALGAVIFLQNGQAMRADQARKQLRNLYKVELAYANRICDMSPEQREQVAVAAVESIDVFMKKLSKKKKLRARGGGFINGQATLSVDQRATVQAEVKKLVDTNLRPEQAARYLEEITKRDKRFQQATVQFFVARIDEKLRLTEEQRTKLQKALEDNWREQYGQTVEVLMMNPQFVPQVSSGSLMAILDDYQKDVWRTLQRIGPQQVGIFGRGRVNEIVDDFELPEEEANAEPVNGGADVLIEGGIDVLIE